MRILVEDSLFLMEMTPSLVTLDYVKWFSDPDVVKYSDNQYQSFSLESQLNYVSQCCSSENILLLGIFEDASHIGNICVNNILSVHKRVDITYVIGDRNYWGGGVMTKSVKRTIALLKDKYDLNKICAGLSSLNVGSQKVLEKNKFIIEGVRKNHLLYDGVWSDLLEYGLFL